jgi:hypothetical protein
LFVVGKILLPGVGILVFVWETLSAMYSTRKEDFPVVFEEVKFLRATTLKENQDVYLSVSLPVSGMYKKSVVSCKLFSE